MNDTVIRIGEAVMAVSGSPDAKPIVTVTDQ